MVMTAQQVFVKMNNFMLVVADMKLVALPDYDELFDALLKTKLKLHPAEAHGLCCGMLCGGEGTENTEPAWEKIITGSGKRDDEDQKTKSPKQKTTKQIHQLLTELYEITKKELDEFLFEFELLLPNDSQNLSERAEALTLWCQGFLTGLKVMNIPIPEHHHDDVSEAINDIVEIAKMNYEDVVESEEDEAAYVELVEFVRMAVVLIYQDGKSDELEEATTQLNHLH